MGTRYFEDISVGETHDLGSWAVSKEEIVGFADRYDPQPFHTDETAAQDSIYGGLIASGWQTVALSMRVMVDGFLNEVASMGARGVDDLQWSQPVYPGDTVRVHLEVLEKRPNPNSGIGDVRAVTTGVDPEGEEVVSWISNVLIQQADRD